jgi:hypothetical protein
METTWNDWNTIWRVRYLSRARSSSVFAFSRIMPAMPAAT